MTLEGDVVHEFVSSHFVKTEVFGQITGLFRARWFASEPPEVLSVLE